MGVRYSRVYSLPENLYLDGSPVLIAAGALLKDNNTGNILVQLKLRNLYHSYLTACKVSIRAFDPGNEELAGVDGHSYLDLSIACGADFGSREAILLPNITTRRFSVSVTQAVFEDGTVWQHSVTEWMQPMLKKQVLSDVLVDYELRKQYRIETGGESNFVPETAGDLFLCACGTLNLISEKTCYNCHRKFDSMIAALDVESLTSKKDERLAKEEAERQERMRLEAEREKERQRKKEEEREELLRQAEERRKAKRAARKKKSIIALTVVAVIAIVIGITVCYTQVMIPLNKYKAAERMLSQGDYDEAVAAFDALGNYKDAAERKRTAAQQKNEAESQRAYNQAEELLESGDPIHAAISFYKIENYKDAYARSMELWNQIAVRKTLVAGYNHTVGLRSDGTVVATGYNGNGQCNVSGWTDIVAVSAGDRHTVGLRSDGTVVATGMNVDSRCNTETWRDIVAVASGACHTVGVQADGTVLAVGDNRHGQCDTSAWTDIWSVDAGMFHTVGLRSDGTVLVVGDNSCGQCYTETWVDVVAVAAGDYYTVGLCSDGTVLAVGDNSYGQCDARMWRDIAEVSANKWHTVGLRSDGTVVATGYNGNGQCNVSGWTDIVAVSTGNRHTVGLRSDGTEMATGMNVDGQCNVSSWTNIKLPSN